MKPIFLIEDVNLSIFDLNMDKNTINIELLDMYEGAQICTMILQDILIINYSCFMQEEEVLPAYIGKIDVKLGNSADTEKVANFIHPIDIYAINIEGWLDIEILCTKCEILNSKK